MGGSLRTVHKTTVYLPDELREALALTATARGLSEAAVIRQAIAAEVASSHGRPRPGIIATTGGTGGASLAEHVDEVLEATDFGR